MRSNANEVKKESKVKLGSKKLTNLMEVIIMHYHPI